MRQKKTLKEKVVALHEAHVEEEIVERAEASAAVTRDSFLMVLGGVRAVNSVAEALGAQSIRALQRIRDEELYRAEGFTRFDTFLDESPLSPMNYKKFNRLETALLNEGDELFNYLNAINAPMARRRLLGKGTLTVEGEEIVVRHDKDEQRIAISDRGVLLSTLSKLADQTEEQRRTIERQKKKLKKGEDDYKNLQRQTPNGAAPFKATPAAVKQLAFDALAALGLLTTAAGKLPEQEALALRESLLTPLAEQWDALHAALRYQTTPGAFSGLTAHIGAEQLEELTEM
ncbi:MAG: hypothetical protein ABW208_07305 [Pyrinomonadaceae bacterium]